MSLDGGRAGSQHFVEDFSISSRICALGMLGAFLLRSGMALGHMRRIVAVLFLAIMCGPAVARDDAAILASDLASKPLDLLKAKAGEIVIVRGIGCVDPGSSGFFCVAKVGTKSVRLDATPVKPVAVGDGVDWGLEPGSKGHT